MLPTTVSDSAAMSSCLPAPTDAGGDEVSTATTTVTVRHPGTPEISDKNRPRIATSATTFHGHTALPLEGIA